MTEIARTVVLRWSSVMLRGAVLGLLPLATAVQAADLVLPSLTPIRVGDLPGVQTDFLEGQYDAVIRNARSALRENAANTDWNLLLIRALLVTGKYSEADTALREALAKDDSSIRLRWLAREVDFATGRPAEAEKRIAEILALVRARAWMYRSVPADLVVIGRAALLMGSDPKAVLDDLYGLAQRTDPKVRDIYLARGDLAMEKHDFALAARAYEEGLKLHPEDPDLLSGRAKAYATGDRKIVQESLTAALKKNPKHIPSLLQIADHHIDAESYTEAAKVLDEITAINPVQPDAWAYHAVMAHLRNDTAAEESARNKALSSWSRNPRVDWIIGSKLAQKYRFAEGAAAQRRALAFDPNYLPATADLAQALLRLGEETEGWQLAHEVHRRDDYDVEAFNLVTLHETMKSYTSLVNEDFVVRMASPEVAVYGQRVLALLRRAKEQLAAKYGVELQLPTYIEIFADQKDFAVRTFGLPDVAGFLGVCFGRVVTANSPAAVTSPTNWESVLWHEFCHVITLQLTKNKMPRWLSEGISVYEERQADPAWGMRLNPTYIGMIEAGDLVPVSKLSSAFLSPKTPQHLQFAYLQSAMVVEFIVEKFGIAALRGVLNDLRNGMEINAALTKNTAPMEQIEKDFDVFAKAQAKNLAPGMNWEKPEPELLRAGAATDFAAWEKDHPDNYWALRLRASRATEAQNWQEARKHLERLVELYPKHKEGDTPYRPLVATLRALNDTAAEKEVLKKWVAVDDEATDGFTRLMELASEDKDWATVARNADRYLSVNPLVAPPYRFQAKAATELGDLPTATLAWRTLLQLDVPDLPEAHFQLAQLLHRRDQDVEAYGHLLVTLEDTPRYQDALKLLAELKPKVGENYWIPPPPNPQAAKAAQATPAAPAGNGRGGRGGFGGGGR